jgi:glycine N-methyltransferase
MANSEDDPPSSSFSQYSDKVVAAYDMFIGPDQQRTDLYRNWLTNLLKSNNCHNILDAACGRGVDSVMLLEEGFNVMSTDGSYRMLMGAFKQRWERRKEPQFDNWVIEEASWLTLKEDLAEVKGKPAGGFDAVLCLGNSLGHILDYDGAQTQQKTALVNLMSVLKPGGILLLDHRNYDEILATGRVPTKTVINDNANIKRMTCSVLRVDGKPKQTTFHYYMDVKAMRAKGQLKLDTKDETYVFKLSGYPHQLEQFQVLLRETLTDIAQQEVYGDYKPVGEIKNPSIYIHVIRKAL